MSIAFTPQLQMKDGHLVSRENAGEQRRILESHLDDIGVSKSMVFIGVATDTDYQRIREEGAIRAELFVYVRTN